VVRRRGRKPQRQSFEGILNQHGSGELLPGLGFLQGGRAARSAIDDSSDFLTVLVERSFVIV